MSDNDRRILKFLCYVVIQLIIIMDKEQYLMYDGLTILDTYIETDEDNIEFPGHGKRVIDTLQDYIDG